MPESLRPRALKLLARREYSRAELKVKLAMHAESEEQLDRLLDILQAENLLSDQRYAVQRVAARAARLGDGRLRRELRMRGVGEDEIAAALAEGGDEAGRCRAIWQKKFGTRPSGPEEIARQTRFLLFRGFAGETIRRVLQGEDE